MSVEESIAGLKTDLAAWLHRLQHGKDYQSQDPVFDGMVRDFLNYDATLHAVEKGVDRYMEGVEALAAGMSQLSEACVLGLTKRSDAYICRDACRYREAVHRICRTDAPNAALAKLRRDLQFNVADPLRKHREHNRKLKHEFQVRRRRLAELVIAKRALEAAQAASGMDNTRQAISDRLSGAAQSLHRRSHPEGTLDDKDSGAFIDDGEDSENRGLLGSSGDARLSAFSSQSKSRGAGLGRPALEAEVAFEEARQNFKRVDDVLFEWLQMLELYRCDIFDSLLQSLKYVQYEFFATSAHAVAHVLPKRMEFRPMVEMTPQHLQAQIEIELAQRAKDHPPVVDPAAFSFGSGLGLSATERLVEKWERDAAFCATAAAPSSPASNAAALLSRQPDGEGRPVAKKGGDEDSVSVDILSLAVLTAQGFSEAVAKAALTRFDNETQAALDFLLSGGEEELRAEAEAEAALAQPPAAGGGSALAAAASSPRKAAAAQAAELAASAALDDVRLPTTLKWVQRLREIRRQERLSWQRRRAERDAQSEGGDASGVSGGEGTSSSARRAAGEPGPSRSADMKKKDSPQTESGRHAGGATSLRGEVAVDAAAVKRSEDSAAHEEGAQRRQSVGSNHGGLRQGEAAVYEDGTSALTSQERFMATQDQDGSNACESATPGERVGEGEVARAPSEDLLHMSQNEAFEDEGGVSRSGPAFESEHKSSPELLLSFHDEKAAQDVCTAWPMVPLPELLGSFKPSDCAWSNAKEVERKVKEETEMLKRKIAEEARQNISEEAQCDSVGCTEELENVSSSMEVLKSDRDDALGSSHTKVEDLLA